MLTTDDPHGGRSSQAAGQRHRSGSGCAGFQGFPADLQRFDGLGQALELQLSQRGEGVRTPATGVGPHEVGGQDLATLGSRAEAGGLDDRVAEVVVGLPARLARAQPHAESERPVRTGVVPVDDLLHRHRAAQRRRCGWKDHHEAVAQVLHLGATGGGEGLSKGREVLVAHLVACFGGQRRCELRGVHQIGEEHRDVLTGGHRTPFVASSREIRRDQGFLHGCGDRPPRRGRPGGLARNRGDTGMLMHRCDPGDTRHDSEQTHRYPRRSAEVRHTSGSADGLLIIASGLVDLTALAEVNRPGIRGGSGGEEDALTYGKSGQGTMSGAVATGSCHWPGVQPRPGRGRYSAPGFEPRRGVCWYPRGRLGTYRGSPHRERRGQMECRPPDRRRSPGRMRKRGHILPSDDSGGADRLAGAGGVQHPAGHRTHH